MTLELSARSNSPNGSATPCSPSDSAVQQGGPEKHAERGSHDAAGAPLPVSPLAVRVHGEYREMPGLRLTVRQAARLFSLAPDVADAVLQELRHASILARSDDGTFFIDR
jgi:hypothetical protein